MSTDLDLPWVSFSAFEVLFSVFPSFLRRICNVDKLNVPSPKARPRTLFVPEIGFAALAFYVTGALLAPGCRVHKMISRMEGS